MKVELEKTIKLELNGEDMDNFKCLIKKIHDSLGAPGFNRIGFSEKENEFLKQLNIELEKL